MRYAHLMVGMALLVSALSASRTASAAPVYSAAGDWSIASNPNGVWRYGFLDPTNSNTSTNLTNFNFTYANWDGAHSGVEAWNLNNTVFGAVAKNTTGTQQTVHTTIQMEPDQMILHPNNSATQAANVRFTAPSEMYVNVAATYAAADTLGTTTDVHVYVNGSAIYNSNVSGVVGTPGVSYASPSPIHLLAGQTIDFSVGFGANQSYGNDGTSLLATVTVVPEPSSFVLGLGAAFALATVGRRKK